SPTSHSSLTHQTALQAQPLANHRVVQHQVQEPSANHHQVHEPLASHRAAQHQLQRAHTQPELPQHRAGNGSMPQTHPELPLHRAGNGSMPHEYAHGEAPPTTEQAPHPHPASPGRRPPPHPELDHRDHELVDRLHQRRMHADSEHEARAKEAPQKPRYAGDRGTLLHGSSSVSTSVAKGSQDDSNDHPAAAAVAAAAAAAGQHFDPEARDSLSQEVAAREVELRVLRKEVERRSQQAVSLEEEIRDVETKLQTTSGFVGTLSAKVEATAGNRHAVLHACALQTDSQVEALRRRLARMDWELAEKDEELQSLHHVTQTGSQQVHAKEQELHQLQQQQHLAGSELAKLQQDSSVLQKHMAIDQWRHKVQAQIEQEDHDAALVRERREHQRQAAAFQEEISTLRSYTARMEEKAKHHTEEISRRQLRLKDLAMEERLCVAAARLGHETADEQKRGHIVEQRSLEARLHEEKVRKSGLTHHASAYDAAQADTLHYQRQLAALTGCVREVSRALHEPVTSASNVAIDSAMERFLHSLRQRGHPVPPVVRTGPEEHRIGHDLAVRCELSAGGQLCVREKLGGLMPIADFFRRHGLDQPPRVPAPTYDLTEAQGTSHHTPPAFHGAAAMPAAPAVPPHLPSGAHPHAISHVSNGAHPHAMCGHPAQVPAHRLAMVGGASHAHQPVHPSVMTAGSHRAHIAPTGTSPAAHVAAGTSPAHSMLAAHPPHTLVHHSGGSSMAV
ncbi:unnamed protein product, partial [Polarella glacialis]